MVLRSGVTQKLNMPLFVHEYTWKNGGYRAMVTMPPDRIPVTATEPEYLAAIQGVCSLPLPSPPNQILPVTSSTIRIITINPMPPLGP